MFIDDVRLVLRITTTKYDSEIQDLIDAAKADLRIARVVNIDENDPLVGRAIKTYCKANFGMTDPADRADLTDSYEKQRSRLQNASGYTDFGGATWTDPQCSR